MKLCKCYLWLFSLLLSANAARAQLYAGLEAGWNRNETHTSTAYRTFTRYKPVNGFSIEMPVQYRFNNWLAIQTGISYIQKNYRLERTQFFDGIYEQYCNSYIQLSLMGRFFFGGQKLRGYFDAGGYAAYWAGGRTKGVTIGVFSPLKNVPDNEQLYRYLDLNTPYSYDEQYTFDSRRDRRLELGLATGAGISYSPCGKGIFFIEAHYYRAMTDQQKNYMIGQIPRYNDTYALQVGYLFLIRFQHSQHLKTAAQ